MKNNNALTHMASDTERLNLSKADKAFMLDLIQYPAKNYLEVCRLTGEPVPGWLAGELEKEEKARASPSV
ncbi:MAG: hypothetical protein LBH42_10425 [Treponema sp.]|jgi:hypothetical protein|nr:hypothetical protein [Treponema sp.]